MNTLTGRSRHIRGKAFAFALLAGLWGLVAGIGTAAAQQAISIGTASGSGTLYIIGAGLAQVINRHAPDVRATAESTAGSVENLNLTLRKAT